MSAALVALTLWAGSQTGLALTVDAAPLRVRYATAAYTADAPGLWRTERWRIDAGRDLYVGYSWLDHRPYPPQTWRVSYQGVMAGWRGQWWDIAWRPDGWDVAVAFPIGPSLAVGFENWRWINECHGCEWSGITLTWK